MKPTRLSRRNAALVGLLSFAVLAYSRASARSHPAPADPGQHACLAPEDALRRYVRAVNAGDFDAQYALFAPVEHEGAKPAPIPLLPKQRLRRVLEGLRPPFPTGLKLSARPLKVLNNVGSGKSEVGGFLIPVLDRGRPTFPGGRYSSSYVVAIQPTPLGWKIRSWATYWMYFERAHGHEAGVRFRKAYQMETTRPALLNRAMSRVPTPGAG